MRLCLRIKEVRKANHKRLEDIAEALGKSRATAYRYETDPGKATLNDLARIAEYLGVSLTDLWVAEEDEEPAYVA